MLEERDVANDRTDLLALTAGARCQAVDGPSMAMSSGRHLIRQIKTAPFVPLGPVHPIFDAAVVFSCGWAREGRRGAGHQRQDAFRSNTGRMRHARRVATDGASAASPCLAVEPPAPCHRRHRRK